MAFYLSMPKRAKAHRSIRRYNSGTSQRYRTVQIVANSGFSGFWPPPPHWAAQAGEGAQECKLWTFTREFGPKTGLAGAARRRRSKNSRLS
jgi:hypothetical protein